MNKSQPLHLGNKKFSSFFKGNPQFDLLNFDFYATDTIDALNGDTSKVAAHLDELRPYQRLLRLIPGKKDSDTETRMRLEATAQKLLEHGLDSAHAIAAMSQYRFLKEFQQGLGLDKDEMNEIHRRAVQIKSAVRHLFANVRDVVGSAYSRASLARYADTELVDYFEGLPSYQSLFGSLDYIEVPECASIFSPAAYFLDIMRITDEYISYYNQETIPFGYSLKERRPDLFNKIKLSCSDTLDTLPYVSLITEILEQKLLSDLGNDPYQALATAGYPFNLPYNRPLTQTAIYLGKLQTALTEIGQAMLAANPTMLGFDDIETAAAYLTLSAEQIQHYTTVNTTDTTIGMQYGLPTISEALPRAGTGTVTYVKDGNTASGADGSLGTLLKVDQQFESQGQIRTVDKIINNAGVEVDIPWVESGTDVAYTISGYPVDITTASTFRNLVGNMSYQDLSLLLTQGLSSVELTDKTANLFFINATNEGLEPMALVEADATKGNIYSRITNLSHQRLDRMSRFIRLSRAVKIDYITLNWLMQICGADEITTDFLVSLANVQQLASAMGLTVIETAAFVGPFKIYGQGDGTSPADPFDTTFNTASLLKGANPFTAKDPIPFDPSRPLAWAPEGITGEGVTGKIVDASATTAILTSKASSENNTYNGLQLTISAGPGAGQSRIIKSYSGANQMATLYDSWTTTPTNASTYEITHATGLEERLAAALQVKKIDLPTLGAYYKKGNGDKQYSLALDLNNLTGLWRLAKLAWIYRVPVAEYLLARDIAGISAVFSATAVGAIQDTETAITILEWLLAQEISAYELAYVLYGTRSRFVRPPFDPEETGSILADLASSSKSTFLTAATLQQAGFSSTQAKDLVSGLEKLKIINAAGLVVPHDAGFSASARYFPVTVQDLASSGVLDAAEAQSAIDALTKQLPPILSPIGDGDVETAAPVSWQLAPSYIPATEFSYLFIDVDNASQKRNFLTSTFDILTGQINFELASPLFQIISDITFVNNDIGSRQSQAAFSRLEALDPPVIQPDETTDTGFLCAYYSGQTTGWDLFTSPASGQSGAIASYDAQTHTATVNPAWTTSPDPFSYFQIVTIEQSGIAQGGGKNYLTLAADASGDDGAYNGYQLAIMEGTGKGQRLGIISYDGASKIATVSKDWTTSPDNTSKYQVETILLAGNADGGTDTTIDLGERASDQSDFYNGAAIYLLADPAAENKTAQVATTLNNLKDRIIILLQTLGTACGLQQGAVMGGLNNVLTTTTPALMATLGFASSSSQPRQLVPIFLGGNTEENRTAAAGVMDGLSQMLLLRSKIIFKDEVWTAMARRPDLYNIADPCKLTYDDTLVLSAFKTFTNEIGDDDAGIDQYLQIQSDIVSQAKQLDSLYKVTDWPADQVSDLANYYQATLSNFDGIRRLDGLLRLAPAFDIIKQTAANSQYLISVAGLIKSPALGPSNGAVNDVLWQAETDVSTATLSVVAARFGQAEFPGVSDKLRRGVDTTKRNALMTYLIRHLHTNGFPSITSASDLFQFLLIDVETSGCDTTSQIAQGITSVQLYMQRCRMGLEPGVVVNNIPPVWWEWMSAYRIWEVNRKIFLYPENYIVPGQRKSASPEFKKLADNLMQSRPTGENIAKSMVSYFDEFEALSNLRTVGGYKSHQEELEGGQLDETVVLVSRTNTSPYQYFSRNFTRSTLTEAKGTGQPHQIVEWTPWKKIDATIDTEYVTPVWAFDRLFLFWNEIKPTKSSKISTTGSTEAASSTQSIWQSTLKYTFETSTGEWLAAQGLEQSTPIRIAPNGWDTANQKNIAESYNNIQHYWHQPFAQHIPRGLPGTGTLTFKAGTTSATGAKTRLDKQINPGDFIFTAGQKLQIGSVDAGSQTLTTKTPFILSGTNTLFNVIPKDPKRNRYSPYDGQGTVRIVAGTNIADGDGTEFTVDFTPGDYIQVGSDTRTVNAIFSDNQLVVSQNWTQSTESQGTGTVTIFKNLTVIDGNGTDFENQANVGDMLVAEGQARTIFEIESATSLLVDKAFDFEDTKTSDYKIGVSGKYTVLPRADGNERLAVFYGPNLEIQGDYGPNPANPVIKNPGEDPFISATNEYNSDIFNALNLIQVVKNDSGLPQHGDITGQTSLILNGALSRQDIRLYAPEYNIQQFQTSPMYKTVADRENNILFVSLNDRPLIALYWGNSSPGTTANSSRFTVQDRALLYHINSENSALVGIGNQVGWYLFNNNQDSFFITLDDDAPVTVGNGAVLRTFWQPSSYGDLQFEFGPYTLDNTSFSGMKFRFMRLTTDVAQTLKQRLYIDFDSLLSLDSQYLQETPFDQYYLMPEGDPPSTIDTNYLPQGVMDFYGAYGLYFWEIFFHSLLLIAEWVKSNQDFETAKRWYEYVFNPTSPDSEGGVTGNERYWQFRPFREGMTIPALQQTLTNTFEINKYNNDPFDPDAIARLRISAYAKTAVLKYVDNLIKWADALFTQDTRESIAQATNLYVMAQDLLGAKPEVVGVFNQPDPLTYDEIREKYPDGIPQFLIDLENTPFIPATGQGQRYADVPVNDINAYFGVPDNSDLKIYWDTIDDRLFKIRHCMNINGVVRQLALFAPPIDPAAFIAGYGAGGSLTGGSEYSPYPIPNYRFNYIIAVAKSLADQVMRFGAALLGALDRKDGEALARLRLTQEAQLLNLTTEIKEKSIAQLAKQIDSLTEAKNGANARQQYYQTQIDNDLLPEEISELVLMGSSAVFSAASSVLGAAASVSAAFPQVGSPFAMTFGGQQLGPSLQNASGWTAAIAKLLETTANILSVVANHKRRVLEWELQERLANFDVSQFTAQIEATTIQQEIAQRDLQIHQTQMGQNQATQEFYDNKFTNEALYSWMVGQLSRSYFQAYSLALEFAKMAQRAYQFEYRTTTSFIAGNYWNDLYRGLTAGESLGQALNQLEGEYIRSGIRLQEMTKVISLRQLDPLAFMTFVQTGETQFEFTEQLFDLDFPGHYRRRIKTLKVSIPALVGPYQNIHATLTQTANRAILQHNINAVKFLLGDSVEVPGGVIEHNVRPYQKISLSQGQGDSGVLEANSTDPLYLPFEQTGAISAWRLSMPKNNNAIDYDGIADVIIEIGYSALDGGDAFKNQVENLPQLRTKQWTQLIQPVLQYQANWYEFMQGAVTNNLQSLSFSAQNLIQPNISSTELLGFYIRLDVPNGANLGAQKPYITVKLGEAEAVSVLPNPEGTSLALFDRATAFKSDSINIEISFNLNNGYTPSSLKTTAGDRLDPDILKDVETVLFLQGKF